ncbi:MAG: hypothetical protein IIA45_02875 [Bacteroidetes bacterium]|nr:hypothetical protein [Bacteroidota bacterium]
MKTKSYYIVFLAGLILFICTAEYISAQCTVTIPDSNFSIPTLIVEQDTTIPVNAGSPGQDYLICTGAKLIYSGSQSIQNKYFVEKGAKVEIRAYHYPTVYVKSGGTLDEGVSLGYQVFQVYYESGATFIDTAGTWAIYTLCNSLVFDYSLLPGGQGCDTITNINTHYDVYSETALLVYSHPIADEAIISVFVPKDVHHPTLFIYNYQGQVVKSILLQNGMNNFGLNTIEMQDGLYLFLLRFDNERAGTRKVIVMR